MQKELMYFDIEGSYGGNQKWFKNPIMRLGGCASVTVCDLCIYLSIFKEVKGLYPFNLNCLSKNDYIKFSNIMKNYFHPRMLGINKLQFYVDGLKRYFNDNKHDDINISSYYRNNDIEDSKNLIINQIDKEIPIPFLLLRHRNKDFREYVWHWFLIVGYRNLDNKFFVKTATYGRYKWILLDELLNTGYEEDGGMIIIDL